jgi:hypothetical protein
MGSEFIFESLGGIPLFSFSTEVQVRNRSRARCVQASWKFRTYQPRRGLKNCRKECVQKSLRGFEFGKGSSGGFAPSRCSRGGRELWSPCRGQVQEKDRRVNLEPEVLKKKFGWLEFSENNSRNSENRRIYKSCKVDKGPLILTYWDVISFWYFRVRDSEV